MKVAVRSSSKLSDGCIIFSETLALRRRPGFPDLSFGGALRWNGFIKKLMMLLFLCYYGILSSVAEFVD